MMQALTQPEIVRELDKYIIGQERAKKAVAVALRNRYRRMQLTEELRAEVAPKNILMIGPTGVGKTEIARRMARLAHAPFLKVEVTKFTQVGYVGRDVESIVRDLVDISMGMVQEEKEAEVRELAEHRAHERLLTYLLSPKTAREIEASLDGAPEKLPAELPAPSASATNKRAQKMSM